MAELLLKQARHNESALQLLCKSTDEFFDWKFTMLYYAALHYMKAWLREQGYDGSLESHFDVLEIINRQRQGASIYKPKPWVFFAFKNLHKRSSDYRYQFKVITTNIAIQKADYNTAFSDFCSIKKELNY